MTIRPTVDYIGMTIRPTVDFTDWIGNVIPTDGLNQGLG